MVVGPDNQAHELWLSTRFTKPRGTQKVSPRLRALIVYPAVPPHSFMRACFDTFSELNRPITIREALLTKTFGSSIRPCVQTVGIDTRPSLPWGNGAQGVLFGTN